MTFPLPAFEHTHGSDVSIIRREFVDLTGNLFSAVILNQLLYWTLRVKDFDYLLEEEKRFQPNCNVSPRHGWIYKTAQELNEETMLGLSSPSIRKYLKLLIDEGWIDEREHPTEKWNKTTQYRINLRRLQEDLVDRGRSLPEVYLKAFGTSLQLKAELRRAPTESQNTLYNHEAIPNKKFFDSKQKNFESRENVDTSIHNEPHFPKENLNQRNFASSEKIFSSDEKSFASDERNFGSNEKFFGSNTENTTENINKEHTHRTCAREAFENLEKTLVGDSGEDQPKMYDSIADEMICLWEQHVLQKLLPLRWRGVLERTESRKEQLSSLLAFHFKNDMCLWERFCVRVKSSNFMMGGGSNGWKVTLDWILDDGNLRKVLEGNYDNSARSSSQEPQDYSYLDKVKPNPERDAEKEAILSSIKDPVWKNWCTQLATGVRLNELRMLHEPLSVSDLRDIAGAWFLECEDERLVWVGSHDPSVLRRIENLRLNITSVFAKEYPKARALRTRLVPLVSIPPATTTGENNV